VDKSVFSLIHGIKSPSDDNVIAFSR
jgi:hypothetical protein